MDKALEATVYSGPASGRLGTGTSMALRSRATLERQRVGDRGAFALGPVRQQTHGPCVTWCFAGLSKRAKAKEGSCIPSGLHRQESLLVLPLLRTILLSICCQCRRSALLPISF